MAYFNKKGKLVLSDSYSPTTKDFEVKDTYTPYKKKKFEEELEAIRKFQADAAEDNREEVVDDSQHTTMTNTLAPMSNEMRNRLRKQMEAKYSATDDSEDYSIEQYRVGVPSNPFDQEKHKAIAEAEHATKLEPLKRNFSEFAASIPETDSAKIVKEVTDRRLKEEQYDRDYKEGLARWASENSKVEVKPETVVADVTTPKFKVSEVQFAKTAKPTKEIDFNNLNLTVDPDSVSLDDFTWDKNYKEEVEDNPFITKKTEKVDNSFDFTAEDAISSLIGFIPHPAAQAFGNMNTIKSLDTLYNKHFK